MRIFLIAMTMAVLPMTVFAGDFKSATGKNYEDNRYQKWASMTAEERDLARQRGETTYRDWNEFQQTRKQQANRTYRHHPDNWQGKTAEEKDKIMQRNSVYERDHNLRSKGRHHPDAWQGKTAEEKDLIKQRTKSGAYKYDLKHGKTSTNR